MVEERLIMKNISIVVCSDMTNPLMMGNGPIRKHQTMEMGKILAEDLDSISAEKTVLRMDKKMYVSSQIVSPYSLTRQHLQVQFPGIKWLTGNTEK